MWKNKAVAEELIEKSAHSIHHLSAVNLLDGAEIPMSKYSGKVMLIVNTASKCGLTPQYKDLQALHEKYASKGLAIIGFPSNDFLNQEPGSAEKIASFCSKNYGVTFDMYEKVNVKGKSKHPIYKFLTEKSENGVMDSSVKWNFQKYLLDKEGRVVGLYSPRQNVQDAQFIQKVETLLQKNP